MTDRVVIRCPGCQQKLKAKQASLVAGIKCPGCGKTLRTKATTGPQADSASRAASARKATQPDATRRTKPATEPTSKVTRGRKVSPPQLPSSKRAAKRPQAPPADPFEDAYADDAYAYAGQDEDANEFDDYADDYADDPEHDNGDTWLNDDLGSVDGAWDEPSELPPAPAARRRKSKSPASKREGAAPSAVKAAGGVMAWVGGGLIAGALSIGLTMALGLTGVSFLIILSAFVSAGMIGGTIRAFAGNTDGWGPGLGAVAIAVPALFLGRVGAYYVDPEISEIFGEDNRTPEHIRQDIDHLTSDNGMIEGIIDDDLTFDDQWLLANGITDENFNSEIAMESDDWNDIPIPDRYHEKVWAEGQRRWNELSPEVRASQSEQQRLNLLLDEGLMDDDSLARLVELRTADPVMIQNLSYELQQDPAWLTTAGVTSGQLDDHYEQTYLAADPLEQIHPVVREEASKRWTEMSHEDKASRRSAIEQELRDEIVSIGEVQDLAGHFRLGAAILWALVSLFMPFRPILVTFASIFLAFKLGSGMATG